MLWVVWRCILQKLFLCQQGVGHGLHRRSWVNNVSILHWCKRLNCILQLVCILAWPTIVQGYIREELVIWLKGCWTGRGVYSCMHVLWYVGKNWGFSRSPTHNYVTGSVLLPMTADSIFHYEHNRTSINDQILHSKQACGLLCWLLSVAQWRSVQVVCCPGWLRVAAQLCGVE